MENSDIFTEGKGSATRVSADCIDDCTAAIVTAGDVEKIKTDAALIGETETEATDKIEVSRKFCRFKEPFTKVEVRCSLPYLFYFSSVVKTKHLNS